MHRVMEKPGKKVILLGNEAVVRGALESGVGFASTYPGTPASEIGDTFAEIAKEAGIYFEYSVNEKVALEAAAGAAFCGVRSIVSFKHFGLNVASDSVHPVTFHGLKAGMVIVVADDPGCWSSGQSEQDSRWYARMMHVPMLEPSNPTECKEFVKLAFEISEKFRIPVFVRTTTRTSHFSSEVKLGKIIGGKTSGVFKKGAEKLRTMPPTLLSVHDELNKKLVDIKKWSEKNNLNPAFNINSSRRLGVITNGAAFNYVMDTLNRWGVKMPVLKLDMTWPLPAEKIGSFVKDLQGVVVVEELEPIIENELFSIAKATNPSLAIYGKKFIPECCELRPEIIERSLANLTGNKDKIEDLDVSNKKMTETKFPRRKPTLCPGCPHRATFWEAKSAAGPDTVFGGDIGCYILGIYPPLETSDFIISMGAVQGLTHGIKKLSKQKAISFIGDSTFFHAGIPGLINMVYNKSDPLVIVLDNRATAMTGHQPHPGIGITGMGEKSKEIKIDDIARASGVDSVSSTNIWDVKPSMEKIKEMLLKPGTKLLVAKGECRLQFMRRARKLGIKVPRVSIDRKKCTRCTICVYRFGCPAIHHDMKKNVYYIDTDTCWGCGVCPQVCPFGAISFPKDADLRKNW